MQKRLKYSAFIIAVMLAAICHAQSGSVLDFDIYTFQLGHKFQADENVKITFEYTNKSDEKVTINKINANCSCIEVVSFTKEIASNEKGELLVSVNPALQLGKFSERILVFTDEDVPPVLLKIEGQVMAGSAEQKFSHGIDSVYMPSKQVNFGYIEKGNIRKLILPLKSEKTAPVRVELNNVPPHLDIFVKPTVIYPGSFGVLDITFNTQAIDNWGFVLNHIGLEFLDAVNKQKSTGKISVTANIREDFSNYTAIDSLNAPVAFIDNNVFNFGIAQNGDSVLCDFRIENKGKNDLIIREVKPSCGCTVIEPLNSKLSSGESVVIKATFSTTGYNGEIRKGITVITNDPVNYKQFLWIQGIVN